MASDKIDRGSKVDPKSEILTVRLNPRGENSSNTTEIMSMPPDYVYRRFKNEREAQQLYLDSLFGYQRIKELLEGTYFETRTPKLCYSQLRMSTALRPVLRGFYQDSRVFVKSAESIKYSVTCGLIRVCRGDEFHASANIEHHLKFLRMRDYEPTQEGILAPCRIPIILSGERSKVERFAGLAYEVMQHQLEPITTRRIKSRMRNHNIQSEDDLQKLVLVGLAEEEIIAIGIIRYCLSKLWQQYRLDFNETAEFNPDGVHPEDAELSKLQVQRGGIGINGVVDFYKNSRWDIRDYLNGRF